MEDTKIVYLTAYRDYVSGAFGVHAFQYLLKPVNKKAIWNVLEEIFRYTKSAEKKIILDFHTVDGALCLPVESIYFFEYENRKIRIVTDKEQYYMAKSAEKKIILDFHTVDGALCLPVESIYFFEYENRKIRIVTDKEQYYMADKIGNVAKRMDEFGFSMPHQSFVVNMFHVKNVKNQQIFLDNGMEIPLSQKKQKIWKQELMEYLSRRLEGRGEVE